MTFEDNNDLDDIVKFVKESITSCITSETKRVLLAEVFLKLLKNYANEEEMGPLRDELVKWAKELDPQPIINLITPETVRTYVKIPLKDLLNPFPEVTVGRTIKTFKNCINKE